VEVLIEAAMQTPDGLWRVEVVRRRGQRTRWYRIVRGDDDAVLDWLAIAAVERILAEAGVDMATLVPVVDAAVDGSDEHPSGTAAPGAA
jgi:bifunctional non-homologous end joining protein LigD